MVRKELDNAGKPRQANSCRDLDFILSEKSWTVLSSLWLLSREHSLERGRVGAAHHQKVPVEVQARNHGGLGRADDMALGKSRF